MNIEFNERGETIIPEGYKWCCSCEALTPHHEEEDCGIEYSCKICGCRIYTYTSCPKCGSEESEDFAEPKEVVVHRDGCHDHEIDEQDDSWDYSYAHKLFEKFEREFMRQCPDRGSYMLPKDNKWYCRNQFLHEQLKRYEERTKCRCPRFIIFRDINQIVTDGGSYFNGDYTCHWFKYKVRCRICGHIYENEDSD